MDAITQMSLHGELHERVRRMIIGGAFEPGGKIPEKELCEQFNVSRTPLREALKVLAAEGLVELSPNRGAVVATITLKEFQDCRPISFLFESMCADLVAASVTQDEIEAIMRACDEMVSARAAGSTPAMLDAAGRIRAELGEATRNPMFRRMYETFFFRMGWIRLVARLERIRPGAVPDDFVAISEALASRRSENLAAAMHAHLNHVLEVCPPDRLPCEIAGPGPGH